MSLTDLILNFSNAHLIININVISCRSIIIKTVTIILLFVKLTVSLY